MRPFPLSTAGSPMEHAKNPGLPALQRTPLWAVKKSAKEAQILQLQQQLNSLQRQEKELQRQTYSRLRLFDVVEEKRKMQSQLKEDVKCIQESVAVEQEKKRELVLAERRHRTQLQQKMEKEYMERMQKVEQLRADDHAWKSKAHVVDPELHLHVQEQRRMLKEASAKRQQQRAEMQNSIQRDREMAKDQVAMAQAARRQSIEARITQAMEQQQRHCATMNQTLTGKLKELGSLREAEIQRQLMREQEEAKKYRELARKVQEQLQEKRSRAEAAKRALQIAEQRIEGVP